MKRVRTKICGITRRQDVQAAADAGADALGFVFYKPSPRAVSVAAARELVDATPAFVTTVGLFVNPQPHEVRDVLATVPLDLLQFHGDESAEFCQQFGRPWIKAIRVQHGEQIVEAFDLYPEASGLLVDAYDPALFGGSGKTFDWSLIPDLRPLPLILAGGLNSANVAAAIRLTRPWAVDVSGGVEASKGIKDAGRINEFLTEVQRVNETD
ncbi:MAG: phosphoribosylanthranilate isomerase [Marinobacter sp.]|nr:phosphoribosylanthranilate isomerase [Marinobacter sp.]